MSENEKLAGNWLVFLGKLARKIDEKMSEENKKPIFAKLLSKDVLKLEDIVKLMSEILKRFDIYLDKNERSRIIFNDSFDKADKLFEGLEELERKNKIKLYIAYGYFSINS